MSIVAIWGFLILVAVIGAAFALMDPILWLPVAWFIGMLFFLFLLDRYFYGGD